MSGEEATRTDTATLDTALDQLTKRDTSRTARVFAVQTVLEGTALSLQDALVAYARQRSRYHFEPPQRVKRDIRAFCTAASEQCIDVDAATVLSAVVPDSEKTVRTRARAIRESPLSPRDRRSRLATFLETARANGFAVTRQDLDSDNEDTATTQPADEGRPNAPVPTDPETLTGRLHQAEQNYDPASGRCRQC
jgi:hypothetical protein